RPRYFSGRSSNTSAVRPIHGPCSCCTSADGAMLACLGLGRGADAMHAQVSAVVFLLLRQAQSDGELQPPIDQHAAHQGNDDAQGRADELRDQTDLAQATQSAGAEDARSDSAPGATQTMQRPDAEHIVDAPAVLSQRETFDEQRTGDGTGG